MLSRSAWVTMRMVSSPSERRIALPPSGSGSPVSSRHHWPRSSTLWRPLCAIGELALVNDEPGLEVAGLNLGDDAVEGDDSGFDLGREELEGEVGRGERAGYGDRELRRISSSVKGRLATIIGP